jgi:uncharacterized protein YbgA (DUF1722 family)/uncharacterized protein YbbK (DUF523 family)
MIRTIKIGISSCLLGENVRYDGGHKLDHLLRDTLGQFVQWVPVCPEVEYGLPVPREAMRLVGNAENPRLVTRTTNVDHTDGMIKWAVKKLKDLEENDLCGFIFKSKSPSSGMRGVKVHSSSRMSRSSGTGIFARSFINFFPYIPVEDDGRLQDPKIRENFIERVFVFRRWKDFMTGKPSVPGLVSFHTDHKLLVMAHSPKHLKTLGQIVAGVGKKASKNIFEEYFWVLMDGLRYFATAKKNVNVLQHMMGYFKKLLSSDEKKELIELINYYQKGLIPLIVPVTLIKHYAKKFDEPYLKKQCYLNPHPLELMLRNHV